MRKPVCVPCGLAMKPEDNGVRAVETKDKEKQEEYRIWSADKWKCPGCGHEVLSGYGDRATYPSDEDYDEKLAHATVIFY